MTSTHVLDERETRATSNIIGRELTDEDPQLAWCGERMRPQVDWNYVSASHVLNAIRAKDGRTPCIDCLLKMVGVLMSVEFTRIDLEGT